MSMSNTPYDPLAAWQKLVQGWELEINSWSAKVTESEQFSAMLGQTTKMMLATQKTVAEQVETLLRSLNLPTKPQIDALAERLDSIEDSIMQLRIAMAKASTGGAQESAAAESKPRRTRIPAGKKDAAPKNVTQKVGAQKDTAAT